ncbi:MAG: hypothetical protein M3319_12335, partial [Actinomycetota bacterium]|nr:hypothetical protein [Actinomycetota bacterium]
MPGALRAAAPAALLVAGLVVAGCGTVGGSANQQAAPPAEPAVAPPGGPPAVGIVTPLAAPATEVLVDPRTRTVAVTLLDPPRLLLRTLDSTEAPRQIPLPGPAADLVLASESGELLVPVMTPGSLVRVPIGGGAPNRIDLDGPARGAVAMGGVTVIALGDRLVVLDRNRPRAPIRGFSDATRLVPAHAATATKIWVLDRERSAVSVVDVSSGEVSPELRAGNGAADAVADRFGRILVTDTRDGELLAFAGDPPLLRQRFPLPGAPYGVAYDARRDLAWVTLT